MKIDIRPSRPGSTACRGSAGFTLLEVLVAVVVLSFGMLGVAGLQAAALQANKDARYQSSAARLARELGDMMRGNNLVAAQAGNPYLVTKVSGPPSPTPFPQNCYSGAACTGANGPTLLAQFEMADWLERVKEELPGALITVCSDTSPYDASGIPQWQCTAGAGSLLYVKIGWTRPAFNASAASATAAYAQAASAPSIVQVLLPG